MPYKNLINLKQADNSSRLSSDSVVAGSGHGALAADAGASSGHPSLLPAAGV
jgi:hypothetical protein